MKSVSPMNKALYIFEQVTVAALELLIVVMVLVSTIMLFVIGFQSLRTDVFHIGTIEELLFRVQRSIAGILIVVMGLELLETLRVYLHDHYVRLEVILVVAIIAASRQVVALDLEHVSAMVLLGLSAIIASLTLGYFLIKRVDTDSRKRPSELIGDEK